MTSPSRTLPAEWAPQGAVMLTWPRSDSDWGEDLVIVEPVFAAIASRISQHQAVIITCADAAHRAHVTALIEQARGRMANILFGLAPANDVWVRDHGPITVLEDDMPVLLDFTFNGWGGKHPAADDNRITGSLHRQGLFGATRLRSEDFVLEGGSIDSDGQGTLLTTTQCLLTPTRNPGLARTQIEERLCKTLGVSRVLWLEHGYLAGDDTDSHVDMLARFCDAQTIAYTACDDPDDEHYTELQRMAAELAAMRRLDGESYRLVPLPLPQTKRNREGDRLPASYANFLIINGAVLVPVYSDPADEVALDRLRACFPGREIIAIPCLPLIAQYGSLHCATMQLPAGVSGSASSDRT